MKDTEFIKEIVEAVQAELWNAFRKHRSFPSHHHAYGVIHEELEEYFDEVREQEPKIANLRKELIQVAASAIRAVYDLELRDNL